MKLIVKQDIKQGEIFPRDTFISYGNSLTKYHISDCQTLTEWEQVEGTYKTDGWYLKIEIPFTRNMLHTNPDTFEQEDGPVRYMIRFRWRPANQDRDAIKSLIRGWFPI